DATTNAFFASQRDPHAPIFIGEVFAPQVTSRNIFPVSKRRTDDTGNFTGIIEVSIQPSAFESFFAGIAHGTTSSLALIRQDGSILARYPVPSSAGIKLDPTSGFATMSRAHRRADATPPFPRLIKSNDASACANWRDFRFTSVPAWRWTTFAAAGS